MKHFHSQRKLLLVWLLWSVGLSLPFGLLDFTATTAASSVPMTEVHRLGGTAALVPAAQPAAAGDGLWRDMIETVALREQAIRQIIPTKYRLLKADLAALDRLLAQAPAESSLSGRRSETVLTLPLPDGGWGRFRIAEYAMLEPDLAAKFSDIKNYLGWGIDDPTATVRLDRTPAGFHGLILADSGNVYLDPYSRSDVTIYLSYYQRDAGNFWQKSFQELPPLDSATGEPAAAEVSAAAATGPIRREYRLAMAATGKYTQFHGGVEQALAAINTTVNRLNGLYEQEILVRFMLVDNNDQIIFTDPETDPYTDGETLAMLNQNQRTLDEVIGKDNYDFGHVLGATGSGGRASLGGVCTGERKAQGASVSPVPVGDSFDIRIVSHEMGHQFGARHTFNAGNAGNCTEPGNRVEETAYEPASGTTIMSYGGTCLSQNLIDFTDTTDRFFHAISLQQMTDFITTGDGNRCGNVVNTGNNAPAVEAGPSYTIPKQTPFTLTGSGHDPDGDTLTYSWEEFDRAAVPWMLAGVLPNTDAIGQPVPIFRFYPPVLTPTRTFPTLTSILNGAYQNKGESLPTIDRTMNFRLTARDGRGGVNSDDTSVTVAATAGPFRVIDPPGGQVVWAPTSTQTVTWNVANTAAAPVNCSQVDILMSEDGGQTFPITIIANTPNDGSETITLAHQAINANIKVQCADNIFFDMAKPGLAVCTPLLADTHEETNEWVESVATGPGLAHNPWTRKTDSDQAFSGSNYWFIREIAAFSRSFLESPSRSTPGDNLFLRFTHRYNLVKPTDGGNGAALQIRVNGGDWLYVDQDHFVQNGYNYTLPAGEGDLSGREVFAGNSGGYLMSVVKLSDLVRAGQEFKIRFIQENLDWGPAREGWYVDDVLLCDVSSPAPNLTLSKNVTLSSSPVQTGTKGSYTIVVANTGQLEATNVRITDTLPSGVSGQNLDTTTTVTAGQRITFTIDITVTANMTGTIVNTAYFNHPSRSGQASAVFTTTRIDDDTGSDWRLYLLPIFK